jgi:uncharacterized protein CbrC (UPF0167 family)
MSLPQFRYHPDPIASGSIVTSDKKCRCCREARGYIYSGPVYAEDELDDSICPWCIADGAASSEFDATFVDSEAFSEEIPEAAMEEITERTPGFSSWQSEQWPVCCDDATAFIGPVGIKEIRAQYHELEGDLLSYIIYEMQVSGGAATRLLNSLHKDNGPTAYLFRCLSCQKHHFYIDTP